MQKPKLITLGLTSPWSIHQAEFLKGKNGKNFKIEKRYASCIICNNYFLFNNSYLSYT